MRSILGRVLAGLGVQVSEAGNGREALEALEAGPLPDVVLVDWNMPEMNGIELVGIIHRRPEWRAMSVMMVTTESAPEQIARALLAGAHEYLIKPFTADGLASKLELLGVALGAPAASGCAQC